ncbi:MAG: hypothetical protein GWN57_06585, partial [Nitrospinaceae bacterium]|nr:hypothetical protein [Nitrospinaceae bacterium]NIW58629.1 hypothetical protein [Nitrospinaceae bacterium]
YPKEGTHCQDCHMRKKPGKIVAPEVVETPETEVSSHDIAGAHSLSLREKSLALEFREIRHHKQKIEVILDITNRAAGHK